MLAECFAESPIQAVADAIAELVETHLPAAPGVAARDVNDELLCVAYGRAFRCFASIRELGRRHEADDIAILTRSLLFIAMRSLCHSLPDDPVERRRRLDRSNLTSMKAELVAIAEQKHAGFTDRDGDDVERVQMMVDLLERAGAKQLPPEEQIAKAIGFGPFYPRVFRPASATAHYSIWSALDGYLEPPGRDGPKVSLAMPSPERAARELETARIVYAAFLEKSDEVIKHGVAPATERLLHDYLGTAASG